MLGWHRCAARRKGRKGVSQKGSHRPTQSDVAVHAGVSRATVSLVLNGATTSRVLISDSTRQRVLDSARALGYTPNVAARMLATGRNQLIGVFTYEPLFPYEGEDFYYPFLLGIERAASEADYDLLLFTRQRAHHQRTIYQENFNTLRLADGAVLLGLHTDYTDLRRLCAEQYPFVYIGRREIEGYDIDWVVSDYRSGSAKATRHLLELGHRRIVLIGHAPGNSSYIDRLTGCQEAVASEPGATLSVVNEDTLDDAMAMQDMLSSTRATALLIGTGEMMARALSLLAAMQIRVPTELSVVSLGDSAGASVLGMQCTEVRLNRQIVGETAAQVLVNKIEGTVASPQHLLIPCDFAVGDTSARVISRAARRSSASHSP